ncbi:hypothetical protein CS8_057690 [Cupriavidus sp. 8B]
MPKPGKVTMPMHELDRFKVCCGIAKTLQAGSAATNNRQQPRVVERHAIGVRDLPISSPPEHYSRSICTNVWQ